MKSLFRLLLLIVLSVLSVNTIGCAQRRPYADLWVQARPYQAELRAARPATGFTRTDAAIDPIADLEQAKGELTMGRVVALALKQSPSLRAAGWGVGAAEADALKMGRPPNPRVGFSAENFGNDAGGPYLQRQTLRLSQVIELGGKRRARLVHGRGMTTLSAWDYEQTRIDVAAQAASRFVAVVVAQQRVELAKQQLKLAEAGQRVADDLEKAGARPKQELDQARTRVALSQIELERQRQELIAARAELAAAWGERKAAFDLAVGGLDQRIDPVDRDALQGRLAQSPMVMRSAAEVAMRECDLELQRANAVPDPTLGGGIRYFDNADDVAGVLELSIPLQAFDDNRHAVHAARLRVAQARARHQEVQADASQQLARAYARYQSARFALNALDGQALPSSESAYRAAAKAYKAGAVDYLTVLEAERTLLEIRNARLDALLSYHQAAIAIERITAHPLGSGD